MKRVLLVKTSSMGDVIHTLPALTDAKRARPEIEFDWVVEEAFEQISSLHPAVSRVIPVAVRRWRRHPLTAMRSREMSQFRARLRETAYDIVLDAQGLLKSALICRLAGRDATGLDRRSAREPLASLFYRTRLPVPSDRHAVERLRLLFANALGYALPSQPADYGLAAPVPLPERLRPYSEGRVILFMHGSSWESKSWPLEYWERLARALTEKGFRVLLPWGDRFEKQDAEWIALGKRDAVVLPGMGLRDLAALTGSAAGVVCGDTGLGHLAVAMNIPTVAIFGPTSPARTGLYGKSGTNLVSDHLDCIPCMKRTCRLLEREFVGASFPPCFAPLDPDRIESQLAVLMAASSREDDRGTGARP